MPLSKDEAATLKALQEKAKEPAKSRPAATLNVSIDLADPEQVKRAQSLGLLDAGDAGDGEGEGGGGGDDGGGDDGGDGDDDGGDDPPQRRGYFNE